MWLSRLVVEMLSLKGTKTSMYQHDIFICHTDADDKLCALYAKALKARGASVWYDQTTHQDGVRLTGEIEQHLQRSSALVVLLTPASVSSAWVRLQIDAFRSLAAHDSARLVLGIRIRPCEVPVLLRGSLFLDGVELDPDDAVRAIIQMLSSELAIPTAPAVGIQLDRPLTKGKLGTQHNLGKLYIFLATAFVSICIVVEIFQYAGFSRILGTLPRVGATSTSGLVTPNASVALTPTPALRYSFLQFSGLPGGGYIHEMPDITTGPDSAIWFLSDTAIGRITTSGTITKYILPAHVNPVAIVNGPEDALWFAAATPNGAGIGRITTAGSVTMFTPATFSNIFINDLTPGPDGCLWFTMSSNIGDTPDEIGRMTLYGMVTKFSLPTALGGVGVSGITQGPDHALWFTEGQSDKIGRITTSGGLTEFALPHVNRQPAVITRGADGALWFTESSGNRIGRITIAGNITEFRLPIAGSYPTVITAAKDGTLWFTHSSGIGRITTSGDITLINLPQMKGSLEGLAVGSDGTLWLTDVGASESYIDHVSLA